MRDQPGDDLDRHAASGIRRLHTVARWRVSSAPSPLTVQCLPRINRPTPQCHYPCLCLHLKAAGRARAPRRRGPWPECRASAGERRIGVAPTTRAWGNAHLVVPWLGRGTVPAAARAAGVPGAHALARDAHCGRPALRNGPPSAPCVARSSGRRSGCAMCLSGGRGAVRQLRCPVLPPSLGYLRRSVSAATRRQISLHRGASTERRAAALLLWRATARCAARVYPLMAGPRAVTFVICSRMS